MEDVNMDVNIKDEDLSLLNRNDDVILRLLQEIHEKLSLLDEDIKPKVTKLYDKLLDEEGNYYYQYQYYHYYFYNNFR